MNIEIMANVCMKAFMNQMRKDENSRFIEKLKNGDFIKSKDLQDSLGITRQAISHALRKNKLFYIIGPKGMNYYPSFYIDQSYDRRSIEKVSKVLGSLSGAVKYHFFTNKSHCLGSKTPLECLLKGEEEKVIKAATSYKEM